MTSPLCHLCALCASVSPCRSLLEVLVLLALHSKRLEPVGFFSEPLLLRLVGREVLRLLHRIASPREVGERLEGSSERFVRLRAPRHESDEPPRSPLTEGSLILLLRVRDEPLVEESRILAG